MICASNHKDSVVGLEAIHLVEEVAPHLIRDERIEVLKDKIARRKLPSFGKYIFDGVFRPKEL